MKRNELVSSREYWITKIQLDLFNQIEKYMTEHQLSRTQLAEKLGVTKGYVSQILNGDFDHKISKLVDLALAVGKAPDVTYCELDKYLEENNTNSTVTDSVFTQIYVRADQIQSLPFTEFHSSEQGIKWSSKSY